MFSNSIFVANIFDLYRDPRESRPENTILLSPWAGGQFNAMVARHLVELWSKVVSA